MPSNPKYNAPPPRNRNNPATSTPPTTPPATSTAGKSTSNQNVESSSRTTTSNSSIIPQPRRRRSSFNREQSPSHDSIDNSLNNQNDDDSDNQASLSTNALEKIYGTTLQFNAESILSAVDLLYQRRESQFPNEKKKRYTIREILDVGTSNPICKEKHNDLPELDYRKLDWGIAPVPPKTVTESSKRYVIDRSKLLTFERSSRQTNDSATFPKSSSGRGRGTTSNQPRESSNSGTLNVAPTTTNGNSGVSRYASSATTTSSTIMRTSGKGALWFDEPVVDFKESSGALELTDEELERKKAFEEFRKAHQGTTGAGSFFGEMTDLGEALEDTLESSLEDNESLPLDETVGTMDPSAWNLPTPTLGSFDNSVDYMKSEELEDYFLGGMNQGTKSNFDTFLMKEEEEVVSAVPSKSSGRSRFGFGNEEGRKRSNIEESSTINPAVSSIFDPNINRQHVIPQKPLEEEVPPAHFDSFTVIDPSSNQFSMMSAEDLELQFLNSLNESKPVQPEPQPSVETAPSKLSISQLFQNISSAGSMNQPQNIVKEEAISHNLEQPSTSQFISPFQQYQEHKQSEKTEDSPSRQAKKPTSTTPSNSQASASRKLSKTSANSPFVPSHLMKKMGTNTEKKIKLKVATPPSTSTPVHKTSATTNQPSTTSNITTSSQPNSVPTASLSTVPSSNDHTLPPQQTMPTLGNTIPQQHMPSNMGMPMSPHMDQRQPQMRILQQPPAGFVPSHYPNSPSAFIPFNQGLHGVPPNFMPQQMPNNMFPMFPNMPQMPNNVFVPQENMHLFSLEELEREFFKKQ